MEDRQVGRHGVVEPRDESVDGVEPSLRVDECPREPGRWPDSFPVPRGLEGPHHGRAHGDDLSAPGARFVYQSCGRRGHLVRLREEGLLFDALRLDLEARNAGVENNRSDANAPIP